VSDETYEIKYGAFEKMLQKLEGENWNELVHFGLDDRDVRYAHCIGGDGVAFDLLDFCNGLYEYFTVMYGDWQHAGGAHLSGRVSKDDLQRWRKRCESIKEGLVRGVYQENILSKVQLGRLVNNVSFEEYIISSGKGRLEAISREVFCWSIEREEDLKEIRKYLHDCGLMV
jgi:hypothetical protein